MSFQASSNFLNDKDQTKDQMATLGQEKEDLRSELQEQRIRAVEKNSSPVDPNQRKRQNATQFCNQCRTNGQSPSWYRKKIRDKKLNLDELPKRKLPSPKTITENLHQTMDRKKGLEVKIIREETRTTVTRDLLGTPHQLIRTSLSDQTPHTGTAIRTMEDHMINAQMNHSSETMDIVLEMNLSTIRKQTAETLDFFPVLHRLKGETSHRKIQTANQKVINLTILLSADPTIDRRVV